jgi:hypothetical protein
MLRPVLNPVTGQIDQELTNAKILKNWADAIDLGDDPDVGAKLSGELNPEVAVKRALTEIAARNKLGLADFNWGRRGALQDDAQAATADESSKARQFTAEQNALRFKNYLDGINLRNKQSGKGEPNEIPVPIIKEITFGLDDFIFATGRDMSLEKYNQFAERVGKRWQRNGNVQQSLNEQWAESFPNSRSYAGAEAEPDTNTWYGGTNRGKLNPYFSDEPSQYSDAFVPGAAPPAAAPSAAPPAAEKPKPKPAGTTAPPPKKRRPIESFGR